MAKKSGDDVQPNFPLMEWTDQQTASESYYSGGEFLRSWCVALSVLVDAAADRMAGKDEGVYCKDWFFCMKPLAKEEVVVA